MKFSITLKGMMDQSETISRSLLRSDRRPSPGWRLTLRLGAEGLRSQQITIRPLGDKLWELKRLYDGIQYRVFFGVHKGAAWLVHGIEKKSAKTPKDDLELARKRLREVMG